MDDPPGGACHLSTKVRQKALEMIGHYHRPIAVDELRSWLKGNDPELWTQSAAKCNDYIRMILAQTKNNVFVKYKSRTPVEGVDRRAVFFGLSKEHYDNGQWIPTCDIDDQNNCGNWTAGSTPKGSPLQTDLSDWNSALANGKEWLDFIAALRPIRFSIQKKPRNKDNIDRIIEDFDSAKCKDNYRI
jgi:hypothetical protein